MIMASMADTHRDDARPSAPAVLPAAGDNTGASQGGTGEGGESSGGTPTSAGATTGAGELTGSGGAEAGSDGEGGCGCRTTPPAVSMAFAGFLLLLRRRRVSSFMR